MRYVYILYFGYDISDVSFNSKSFLIAAMDWLYMHLLGTYTLSVRLVVDAVTKRDCVFVAKNIADILDMTHLELLFHQVHDHLSIKLVGSGRVGLYSIGTTLEHIVWRRTATLEAD